MIAPAECLVNFGRDVNLPLSRFVFEVSVIFEVVGWGQSFWGSVRVHKLLGELIFSHVELERFPPGSR